MDLFVLLNMQEGQRFDKVAQEYSEDKAKGASFRTLPLMTVSDVLTLNLQRVVALDGWLEAPWSYVLGPKPLSQKLT